MFGTFEAGVCGDDNTVLWLMKGDGCCCWLFRLMPFEGSSKIKYTITSIFVQSVKYRQLIDLFLEKHQNEILLTIFNFDGLISSRTVFR